MASTRDTLTRILLFILGTLGVRRANGGAVAVPAFGPDTPGAAPSRPSKASGRTRRRIREPGAPLWARRR